MNTWFAVPHLECPADGPLALGSIISHPKDPEERINKQLIPIPNDEIRTRDQTNFEEMLRNQKSVGASLWFKFVGLMGLEVTGGGSKSNLRLAKFDRLETRSFEPDDDYVAEALATPEVQKYIKKSWTQWNTKPLYIVTAVKIAYGATIKEVIGKGKNAKLSIAADATAAAGAPVSVGAAFHNSKDEGRAIQYSQKDPFVFLFRLREIRYKKGELKDHMQYRDGALYGIGADGKAEEGDGTEKAQEQIVFEGLDEDDVTADDIEDEEDGSLAMETFVCDEDGDSDEGECTLVLPKIKKED